MYGWTVWLSTSTSFSTSGVVCQRGVTLLFSDEAPTTVLCPSLAGAQYVTLQRAPLSNGTEHLVVQEIEVNTAGE